MEVDLYAFCPCGSGKKIKFCKCRDTIGELERIARMVEGNQLVAALDKISQVLTAHPDAAWALAIKGRLLLQLREHDKLKENAERFLRLQPSNPLALLQKSIPVMSEGNTIAAAELVLNAMAESREGQDSLLFEVCLSMGVLLAEMGNYLSARIYLATASMPETPTQETAAMALQEIARNQGTNLLLKGIPDLYPAPASAAWGERFEEAARLLEVNSVLLAESKLEALDRQFPQQPAILSSLLRCAIWRTDQARQATLLGKLANVTTLTEEERDQFQAMSWLLEPGQPQLSIQANDLTWEVSDLDAVLAALQADSRTLPLPQEMAREMMFEEEQVPPRAAFQLIDRERPPTDKFPEVAEIPEVYGVLLVFGRQTDRPARITVINVLEPDQQRVREQVAAAMNTTEPQPQINDAGKAPLSSLLMGTSPALRLRNVTPRDMSRLQRELIETRVAQRFLGMRLGVLNQRTPLEAKEASDQKSKLRSLVRIIEGFDALFAGNEAPVNAVREQLGAAALPQIVLNAGQSVSRIPIHQLARLKVDSLGAEDCVLLIERCRHMNYPLAMRRVAKHLLSLSLAGDLQRAKLGAFLSLAEVAGDPADSLEQIEAGLAFAKANNLSNATLLLSEIGFRLQAGDGAGLQRCIQSIVSEHSANQSVMMQLQQLLVMYGLLNPDGSPRRGPGGPAPSPASPLAGPAPAASSGGGLWTPDAPASQAPAGGKKLWIPGMD